PSEFKFAEVIESTVQGIVDVLLQSVITLWLLVRHPLSFNQRLAHSGRPARPFTFLALSAFIASWNSFPSTSGLVSPPIVSSLRHSFEGFSAERLLTKTLPLVLYVVLVGHSIARLSATRPEDKKQIRESVYYAAATLIAYSFALSILLYLWITTL